MSRYSSALVLIAAILLTGCWGGTAGSKTGAGDLAALTASPSTIDFGNVTTGSNSAQTGTLTAGAPAVTMSSAGWNGQGYSVSGISFPVTLAVRQSVPFAVTFTPQVSGTSSGSISFISDASNSPTSTVWTCLGIRVLPQ